MGYDNRSIVLCAAGLVVVPYEHPFQHSGVKFVETLREMANIRWFFEPKSSQ